MTNPTQPPEPSTALVAPSDIAEMTGVSRGAVSNWRKRSSDFPARVAGTTTKPLFDRAEVEAWLRASGKNVLTDHNLSTWSLLNTLREDLSYEDISQLALDFACLRRLDEKVDTPRGAWTAISQAATDRLRAALQAGIDDLIAVLGLPLVLRRYMELRPEKVALVLRPYQTMPVEELAAVTDYVLARAASAQVRAGVHYGFVESRISRILGALAGPYAVGTIYDPACGIGEAMNDVLRAHAAFGDSVEGPITRVVGHDVSAAATTIAQQRAFLRGQDWEITTADVLARDPEPDLTADIIVCEPPFGQRLQEVALSDTRWAHGMPPRNSSELAWIQHALAHLARDGRAFVVTTMGALSRGGAEGAIRRSLVDNDCVEAIIGLPGKLLPHVAMPLAVWVLRSGLLSAHDERGQRGVFFVDGSKSKNPEAEVQSWYTDTSGDTPTAFITPNELGTAAYDLNPSRWTGRPSLDSDAAFTKYTQSLAQLNHSLNRIGLLERPLRAFDLSDQPRVVTVGELIGGGRLQLKTGRLRSEDVRPEFEEILIEPRHIRAGELPNRPPDTVLGSSAHDYDRWSGQVDEHPDRPSPGDILVTTTGGISTYVCGVEWAILGQGVQALRLLTDELSADYLAAVLCGAWNERFLTGSTVSRAKVQDLEVPLISATEQEIYLEAYDRVADVAEQAQLLARKAADTRVALLDLLRAGTADHTR